MTDPKTRYDIFICGGTQHFALLRMLLPLLYPFGTVHLASIVLAPGELKALAPYFDVLHRPRHHEQGYRNFELFCIRDINRLAAASHFIKLDADVTLRKDWVSYVDESLARHKDVVLFGPDEGSTNITVEISGTLAKQALGGELRVRNGRKVTGGFYVGQTAFFKRHDHFMQNLHGFLYSSSLQVTPPHLRGASDEDVLRSMVVHAQGASDRLLVIDAANRVSIHPHNGGQRGGRHA